MDDRIIEKLQKLLALAGSDNEYEAALAMARAEILMHKHNLNLADVAPDGTGASVVDTQIRPTGSATTYQAWETVLAGAVARAFHGQVVNCYQGKSTRCSALHFVAGKTDMIIILDLFERLRQTIRRKSAAYARGVNAALRSNAYWAGQSYRIGMAGTITERLKALRRNTEPGDEINAHGVSGKDLMIIKNQAIEQYFTELFGPTEKETLKLSVGDEIACLQGRIDGRDVSLHRSMPTADGRPLAIAG